MTGFLGLLKNSLKLGAPMPGTSPDAKRMLEAVVNEAAQQRVSWADRIKLSDSPTWSALKIADQADQVDATIEAIALIQTGGDAGTLAYSTRSETLSLIAGQLLRKKLPFKSEHLAPMLYGAAKLGSLEYGLPMLSMLTACERLCGDEPASGELRKALEAILKCIDRRGSVYPLNQRLTKMRQRVVALLDPDRLDSADIIPMGRWGATLKEWLGKEPPEQQAAWSALFAHMNLVGGKSRATKSWLSDAKPLVSKIGRKRVTSQLIEWLEATSPDPSVVDTSLEILKGLVWLTQTLDTDTIAPPVGRFAATCFRKVPGIGARSIKLGNACLSALEAMAGADLALAEMVRLRAAIKYPSVYTQITERLARIAAERSIPIADLEEKTLPTFDLTPEGRQETVLGNAVATITVNESGTVLDWSMIDGAPRKAPPVDVKRDHAAALKSLKARVKEIEAARVAQISRLEDAWLEDRAWPYGVWQDRFANHPLRKSMASALIWQVSGDDETRAGMPVAHGLCDVDGESIPVGDKAEVRLWHPLHSTPEAVLAWRRRIMDLGLTQPIKQAHREIYVLTDAERRTETYSNRFAAHFLRQHQFRALCHGRRWSFEFLGGWDNWNVPNRKVPLHGLSVEYHVEPVDNDEVSEAYVPLHLATDQVRFIRDTGEQMRLEDVPPVVFSELLRDVDMFVAVTSVANDPDWVDGGPEGRFGHYWRDYAFGDLSQTAVTRRELLMEMVPKLSFADRARVSGRFLEIDGRKNSYKIHLGSSNIQIMPENRYLCIVRGRTAKGGSQVKLPFSGDTMMSIILSKAFMLAEDNKIKDPGILSQLRG